MLFCPCPSEYALVGVSVSKGQNPEVILSLTLSRRKRCIWSLLTVNAVVAMLSLAREVCVFRQVCGRFFGRLFL